MRDLQKDLEICQLASAAPWTVRDYSIYNGERLVADYVPRQRDCYFITAAREGWHEAIQRAMAAEARVKELEAQCAAMREALERFKFPGFINDYIPDNYMFIVNIPVADFRQAEQALSNDAGKTLLERVRKFEAVAEAARELLEVGDRRGDTWLPAPPDDPKPCSARMQTAWDELREALAELEKEAKE